MINKYGNRKVYYDGKWFASQLEVKRYSELKLLEKAKEIQDLKCQVKFELQPAFVKNGKKYRAINYIADFVYYDNKLKRIVIEDTKGVKTKEFAIKQKMFEYKYKELELRIVTKEEV